MRVKVLGKRMVVYYMLDLPYCLKVSAIRTLIAVSFFTIVRFVEKYMFGASFSEASSVALAFFSMVVIKVFLLLFFLILGLRAYSKAEFWNKKKTDNIDANELHDMWKSQ